jgi:hypothetical protein
VKVFLKKTILLAIPLLLFLAYVEWKLAGVENSYSYKRRCFEKRLDSTEVLVLGSSQAAYAVNPSYLSSCAYNLGNVSQSLYYDQHLVYKYLDKLPQLKMVFIHITSLSFGHEMTDGKEEWRVFFYSREWDIPSPIKNTIDPRNYSRLFLYTPQKSFDYFKKGFNVNLAAGYLENGYFKKDTTGNEKNLNKKNAEEAALRHAEKFNAARVTANISLVSNLLDTLKKRNIRFCFFTTPHTAYYRALEDKKLVTTSQDILKELCAKYTCEYYDYSADSRFVARDFFDSDHLNFIGAEKFSRIIDEEILQKRL